MEKEQKSVATSAVFPQTPARPYPLEAFPHVAFVPADYIVKWWHGIFEEMDNIERISFIRQYDAGGNGLPGRTSELRYYSRNDTGIHRGDIWTPLPGGGDSWLVADYGPFRTWRDLVTTRNRGTPSEVHVWDLRKGQGDSETYPHAMFNILLSKNLDALNQIALPLPR
jgi:hypothetical protein